MIKPSGIDIITSTMKYQRNKNIPPFYVDLYWKLGKGWSLIG
jgi:hypothetical protein